MSDYEYHSLESRQTRICTDRYGRQYYCRNSAWGNWGRWVALAVIILFAVFVFFIISCITARRRRKAGRKPFYGTGWAGNMNATPWKNNGAQYNPNYNNTQQAPPPNYNQSTGTSTTGGYNQGNQGYGGYYGNQNQPQGAAGDYYNTRGGDMEMNNQGGGYAPPPGPPPGKDATIR